MELLKTFCILLATKCIYLFKGERKLQIFKADGLDFKTLVQEKLLQISIDLQLRMTQFHLIKSIKYVKIFYYKVPSSNLFNSIKIIIIIIMLNLSSVFSTENVKNDSLIISKNHNINIELHTFYPLGISIQYEFLLNNKIENRTIVDRDGLVFGTIINYFIYGGYIQYALNEGNFADIEQQGFGLFAGYIKPVIGGGQKHIFVILPYYTYSWRDEITTNGTWLQYSFKLLFIMPGFGLSIGYHF